MITQAKRRAPSSDIQIYNFWQRASGGPSLHEITDIYSAYVHIMNEDNYGAINNDNYGSRFINPPVVHLWQHRM